MSQTVQAAITAIAASISGVDGLRKSFEYPPEQITQDCIAVVYVPDGDSQPGALPATQTLLSIAVDVLIMSTRLDRDIARLTPLLDSVPAALWSDPTFGGKISTFESIHISLMTTDYGGQDVRGYQFLLKNVKLIS